MSRLVPSRTLALTVLAVSAAALAAAEATLPAGTVIPVTFETTVSSATARPEDAVLARVRADVRSGGLVVIPRGSELRGRVLSARPSGRVKGRASLAVAFHEVVIDGRPHRLAARRISLVAPKTHGRDAKIIGGGAGAGVLIGALADGGEGAVKGGLIGAGAGTGAVLATKGREVTLRSGGRWRVRLAQPFTH